MTRKVLKRKTSGCCWKKLLGKALKQDPTLNGGTGAHHQCLDQDEIVYLNLYLTSLEKKMQAIEEITRLKWYRQQISNSTEDAQNFIRSSFTYFKDDSCKPLASPVNDYSTELSVTNQNPDLILRGNSDAIIREIMSLGSKTYRQSYESSKWAAIVAPKQDPIITEPERIIEMKVETATEIPVTHPSFRTVGKFHVAAMSHAIEAFVVTIEEEVRVQDTTGHVRASCTIELLDNEEKTIEITYNNREWDKKGTIVLRDIANQIGVQTELIGRVVCFLLGMGEVDVV